MKPYHLFSVKRMPPFEQGQSYKNKAQLTFFGEDEDIETVITMEMSNYENGLSLMRVASSISHKTIGYVKTFIESQKRTVEFNEYLQPVDFPAYYDESEQIIAFQAPKKVAKGVLGHILSDPDFEIVLEEMEVDFAEVMKLRSEYLGAWFRSVSARVSAAGLSGNQIQDDSLFKDLSKVAELSNVTIPWGYEGVEHRIMITRSGGIVLVQSYENNIGLELRLVKDVYHNLLKQVWHPKKAQVYDDQEDDL